MRLANNLPGGESDGAVLGEWSRDLDLASDWLLAVLVDQSGEKLISRDKEMQEHSRTTSLISLRRRKTN